MTPMYLSVCVCTCFHSFIQIFLLRLFRSTATQRCSRHSMDTVLEFHVEALQASASEGLAQGPYVVARVGFESAILRTKGIISANEPPHPTLMC